MEPSVEAISFIKVFQDINVHSQVCWFFVLHNKQRSVMNSIYWTEMIVYKST